jgi:hypothetical protein
MAAITTRAGKGSPLTNAELDANFTNINAGITTTAAVTGGTITGVTINNSGIGSTTPSTGAFTSLTATSASGVVSRTAATEDGVALIGRAGGTSSYRVALTPTTLAASRTLTLPDVDGTVLTTGAAVTVPQGGTGLTSGTSGGVPYFSSATAITSSAALAANALVVGGGAGAAPATVTTGTGVVTALGVNTGTAGAFVVNGGDLGTPSSGTLTNATGLPLSTGVTGTLPVANGGTGQTTLGGGYVLRGNAGLGILADTELIYQNPGAPNNTKQLAIQPPNSAGVLASAGLALTANNNGNAYITFSPNGTGVSTQNTTATHSFQNNGATTFSYSANGINLASGKTITFSYPSGSPTNTYIIPSSRTLAGVTSNAITAQSSGGATNIVIEAVSAGAAGLWLTPNSTGSGTGNVGTTNNLDLRLYRNGTVYQTFDTNGTVFASGRNIGLGGTSPSTSGAGISFPATQSASTDANTLDDYEKGTWTPTYAGGTTAGTSTYATYERAGGYTKIGNVVTVSGYVGVTAATGTGDITITGFPFLTSGAGFPPEAYGAVRVYGNTNFPADVKNCTLRLASNTSVARIAVSAGATTASTYLQMSNVITIAFTITYRT